MLSFEVKLANSS